MVLLSYKEVQIIETIKALTSTNLQDNLIRQQKDIKKGGVVKIYYKATNKGLEVYKYIVRFGNTKQIFMKEDIK